MPSSNALDPQSPLARAIYDLGIVSSIVFALIFVIVTAAITYSIFCFRTRAGEPDPTQIWGNRKVEIAWTMDASTATSLTASAVAADPI